MAQRRLRLFAPLALAAACAGSSSGPSDPPPPTPCTAAAIPGTCRAACGDYDTGTAGVCANGLLCCTPAIANACDSSAHPQPNAGLTEAPGDAGCPGGMAKVGTFCVDRYEASLVDAASGAPWSPYWNPGATAMRAVSLANAVPQGYVSGTQAAAACANAGKRLCTDAEWLRACQGPTTTTYPYGDTFVEGRCPVSRATHPVPELFGTTDAWIWSFTDHPCLDQLPDSLKRTGAFTQCVTAEGVHDMAGNLSEWTADPAGTFRGGTYFDDVINGAGCLYVTTAHDTSHWDFSTGFRCCADGA